MNDFCKQKSIEKEIPLGNGEVKKVTFYAVPFGTVMKMKSVGKSLSKLVTILMTDSQKDVGSEYVTAVSDKTDSAGNPVMNTQSTVKEISPSMASLRHRQMSEAIEELMETFCSEEVQDLLAEIIVKSANKEFSEGDKEELANRMDTETFFHFLRGAFEASAGGIAGLGKFLSPQMSGKIQEMVETAKEAKIL